MLKYYKGISGINTQYLLSIDTEGIEDSIILIGRKPPKYNKFYKPSLNRYTFRASLGHIKDWEIGFIKEDGKIFIYHIAYKDDILTEKYWEKIECKEIDEGEVFLELLD